jgi:hypothetical protein
LKTAAYTAPWCRCRLFADQSVRQGRQRSNTTHRSAIQGETFAARFAVPRGCIHFGKPLIRPRPLP